MAWLGGQVRSFKLGNPGLGAEALWCSALVTLYGTDITVCKGVWRQQVVGTIAPGRREESWPCPSSPGPVTWVLLGGHILSSISLRRMPRPKKITDFLFTKLTFANFS